MRHEGTIFCKRKWVIFFCLNNTSWWKCWPQEKAKWKEDIALINVSTPGTIIKEKPIISHRFPNVTGANAAPGVFEIRVFSMLCCSIHGHMSPRSYREQRTQLINTMALLPWFLLSNFNDPMMVFFSPPLILVLWSHFLPPICKQTLITKFCLIQSVFKW